MNWTLELSSAIEIYAKMTLDKLTDMESKIKYMKYMLKHIHQRSNLLKKHRHLLDLFQD